MAYANVKGPKTYKQFPHYCLGVSLCSRNHEGEALKAIVSWLNGAGSTRGVIDFSDTLHRHNLMIEENLSEEEARKKTLDISGRWLDAHHRILGQINTPYEIISWDRWLSHDKFAAYEQQFRDAFRTQQEFRIAVLRDVDGYFRRRFDTGLERADTRAAELSIAFLIEELAAHSILYEERPSAVIYPGRQQESFRMAREGLVRDVPEGLQHSAHARLTIHQLQDAAQMLTNDNDPAAPPYTVKKA